MSNNKIAPSILAADYANFASELKRIEETSAEYVHIDIMDGQFVSNISFGADVVLACVNTANSFLIVTLWWLIQNVMLTHLRKLVRIL